MVFKTLSSNHKTENCESSTGIIPNSDDEENSKNVSRIKDKKNCYNISKKSEIVGHQVELKYPKIYELLKKKKTE